MMVLVPLYGKVVQEVHDDDDCGGETGAQSPTYLFK